MDRLRSSSPLFGDGDYADVALRRRIWRAARRIAAHQRLHALHAYSEGRLDRTEAIRSLGLRDYAELLVALGEAGLPLPLSPEDEIERQAEMFERLWREGTDPAEGLGLAEVTRSLVAEIERHVERMDADLTGALQAVQAALERMGQADRDANAKHVVAPSPGRLDDGGDDGEKR